MKEINGKKYKWNDYLQQYELVELGRPKKELKMNNAKKWNRRKVRVMAKSVDGCSEDLFFDSIMDASRRFGVAVSTIFDYMKTGKEYSGYTFERVEEIPLAVEEKRKNIGGLAVKSWKTKSRPVVLKTEKNGICFVFSSLNECAKKLGVHPMDVSNAIKSGKHINNFIVEEKIDCKESVTPMKNDLENMKKIISAFESGQEVYCKKKSGGDWERAKYGACDFINYDYKIGCKMSNITVSVSVDEYLKNKLEGLAKSKGISINSLLKDKLKKIIIEEFNMI